MYSVIYIFTSKFAAVDFPCTGLGSIITKQENLASIGASNSLFHLSTVC